MLKDCVILNGTIINVGAWDYQYTEIDGEQVVQNPLPEGATVAQRDMEYDPDRGWHEVGTSAQPTHEDRLKTTEDAILALMGLL